MVLLLQEGSAFEKLALLGYAGIMLVAAIALWSQLASGRAWGIFALLVDIGTAIVVSIVTLDLRAPAGAVATDLAGLWYLTLPRVKAAYGDAFGSFSWYLPPTTVSFDHGYSVEQPILRWSKTDDEEFE